ncbi:MAG: hypothetical protein LBU32_03870 [Clostridiales bacterium]|jgi:hypothetical protein|nr:hypothetical protein [Clostridiales bacterium]
MRCLCCGQDINNESRCHYCGLAVVINLDEFGIAQSLADAHKKRLLSFISEISVLVLDYVNLEGEIQALPERWAKIADASDCLNRIVWCDERFAQFEGQHLKLSVYYRGPLRKESTLFIKRPNTGDFWKVGIMITDSLKLRVFLGEESSFTFSDVALELYRFSSNVPFLELDYP